MSSTVADTEINEDRRTRSIVEAIVAMGHALGLTLVAEGIETAEHLAAVRELGFDIGQGYYIAKPAPATEVSRLLTGPPLVAAYLPPHA